MDRFTPCTVLCSRGRVVVGLASDHALFLRVITAEADQRFVMPAHNARRVRLALLGVMGGSITMLFPAGRLSLGGIGPDIWLHYRPAGGGSLVTVAITAENAAILAAWIGARFLDPQEVPRVEPLPGPLPGTLRDLMVRAFCAKDLTSDALLILADMAAEAARYLRPANTAASTAWENLAEGLRAAAPVHADAPLPQLGQHALPAAALRRAAQELAAYGTADSFPVARLLRGMADAQMGSGG